MEQTPELWKATYDAQTPEELADAYSQWAHAYDRDTLDLMGYVGPHMAAAMLDQHLEDKNSRILDAGCGTGLVGEALQSLGYTTIDAMDYSKDMLTEAEKKSVYQSLYQGDLNTSLTVPDDSYDATICVGTFTYAHVGPQAFEELVRITRPGGHICFTIRDGAYQDYGYRNKMLEMEACSTWCLQEWREADYLINENVTAKFCTYQVTTPSN